LPWPEYVGRRAAEQGRGKKGIVPFFPFFFTHTAQVFDVISLCPAQGEEVNSGLGVGVGVEGAGLAVGDAVGVGFIVGVGVGGGAGMGTMKKTMLRTTIRLRTQKAIWRDLTCDLREPRFTAYLLV